MKSILVIGMGRFGRHLSKKLVQLGNDVMVVDANEKTIMHFQENFQNSFIGDCTKEGVVRSLNVNSFDLCFVTIGSDFESSLVITSLLKKLGAKRVISKAGQDLQAEFLKKIGADEVLYPEKQFAEKCAVKYNANNIFDYIELTEEYAIFEIPVVPEWIGKTPMELDIRNKYKVNVIASKKGKEVQPIPGAFYQFQADEHLIVIGSNKDILELSPKE